ncbi:MAG: hypothetical protein V4735_09755 [Pseudomonadota bacterium]
MTYTVDDTLVLPAAPASAAVPAATASAIIHNEITVIIPPAPARQAAPPKRAVPKGGHGNPPPSAAPSLPGGGFLGPLMPSVSETKEYDASGRLVTAWGDSTGATIVLTQDGSTVDAAFSDANRTTHTSNKAGGFRGHTRHEDVEFGVVKTGRQKENAIPTSLISLRPLRGDVSCAEDKVNASNSVVDAVTRERIQGFSKQHPELADKLRTSGIAVTMTDDKPLTLEQVEKTPSQFRACPAGKPGIVVEKLVR